MHLFASRMLFSLLMTMSQLSLVESLEVNLKGLHTPTNGKVVEVQGILELLQECRSRIASAMMLDISIGISSDLSPQSVRHAAMWVSLVLGETGLDSP